MLFEYAVRKLFDEILAQFKMGLRDFRKFIFGLFVSAAPFLAGFGFGVWLLRLLALLVERTEVDRLSIFPCIRRFLLPFKIG